MTHHSPKHTEIDNINFEIKADKNGIICLANRFGILKYDGTNWDFFNTSSTALSIDVSDDNTLFVGCVGEFGKIDFVDDQYQYVSILANDSITDHFLHTFVLGDLAYFLSEKSLYSYSNSTEELDLVMQGDFLNGYVRNEALIINLADEQIVRVKNGTTEQVEDERPWGLVSSSPSGDYQMAIDLEGGLYQYEEGLFETHPQYEKFKEAEIVLTDIEWVNDTLLACSTAESGIIFLHSSDSSYFEITDYHSGLPDNEIFDIYADDNGGVWVTHQFGLTRISPLFPAYSYTSFPGLEGNLVEAQRIKGDLWVNTSLGVYYFSEDTSFQSRVYVQKVRRKEKRRPPKKTKPTPSSKPSEATIAQQIDSAKADAALAAAVEIQQEDSLDRKKRRGFMKGLFKKKDRIAETQKDEKEKGFFKKLFAGSTDREDEEEIDDVEETEADEAPVAEVVNRPKRKYDYVRRVEKIVTGVSYQFHHVPGTDGKFRQLLETNSRILASSHTGLYEVDKESSALVIDEPIRYAFVIPETDELLVSTEEGLLKHYKLIREIWVQVSSQKFDDAILNMYMDSHGQIWMAGTSFIYQGVFVDDAFKIEHYYEINNKFYDELSVWEHSNNLYFINSQGYFRFDRDAERIVKDRELEEQLGAPHHHIHNEKSRVWIYNGKYWNLLLPDGSIKNFHYLGIYPDLTYINYDELLDRYWLVTQDNQLLSYEANHQVDFKESPLFVKRVTGTDGELRVLENLKLAHNQNSLIIELLKPDYLGFLGHEYQFKLVGLNQDWTGWTTANLIDFNYLPSGNYDLHVRVKDTLGNLNETSMLTFSIATPYWQQPWFYGAQVLILAIMIIVTSTLDDSKSVNRFFKHGLAILTLVVIIQLMQSIIHAYLDVESTPVGDFFIDAGIALSVFPLEWLLRKVMVGGGFKRSNKGLATDSNTIDTN